jgi:hypothetical protein
VEPPAPPPPKPTEAEPPLPTLPELSFRKVKFVTQQGAATREIDVSLMFLDDRLGIAPAGGGGIFRTVRYRDVRGATYVREETKRLFARGVRHLLSIQTSDDPLVLRLDNDNVEIVINALEARTKKAVRR